jgi:CBS domain containing-hemolysin-like protein
MIAYAAAAEAVHPMSFRPWALGVVVILLAVNGAFTATEIALVTTRRLRIEEAGAGGDRRAARVLRTLSDLPMAFSATQLGATMTSLGLGAIAEPAVAALYLRLFGTAARSEPWVASGAVALAIATVVFLHMVVGDMAPKNLAIARADRVVLWLARPFAVFVVLFRPLIALLDGATRGILRLLRVVPVSQRPLVHTPDELALVLSDSGRRGTIVPEDASMMRAALRLARIDAGAAMTPRADVVAIEETATLDEVLERAASSGFTRLPVVRDSLDTVIGLVHVKDALLAADDARPRDLLRDIVAVPETRDLETLLPDLLEDRHHLVLVVDEHGATAGVLSLEDVLEELVGDIADEFDREPGPRTHRGQAWDVPGTLRRDELEALTGLRLEAAETETVSGWMVERLDRLPRVGDVLEHDGWTLRVRSLDGMRAGTVHVEAPDDETDG